MNEIIVILLHWICHSLLHLDNPLFPPSGCLIQPKLTRVTLFNPFFRAGCNAGMWRVFISPHGTFKNAIEEEEEEVEEE